MPYKVLEKGKQHRILHEEVITQEETVTPQEQHETTENDKENTVQTVNSTNTRTGRPKVAYTEASAATKRRIKAEAKSAIMNCPVNARIYLKDVDSTCLMK